ncbi:DUF1990 family protein [Salinispora arenicola]|nr:DUF1990 family protein [Salinispora arenicola]
MGDFPTGYRHAHRMVFLGMGGRAFDRAVHALFAWRMHRRAWDYC